MTSLIAAGIWVLAAHLIAMLPSRDHHWRAAYVLIAIGLPILYFVLDQNGWVIALLVLLGAMSILRWPVYYAFRRIRAAIGMPMAPRDEGN